MKTDRPFSSILVTGGAGFIGSNFVSTALPRFQGRVLVYDKLTYAGRVENLIPLRKNPRFKFIKGDIVDGARLLKVFKKFQVGAVVHLAAETHVDRSIDGSLPFLVTNDIGTYRMLESARIHFNTLRPKAQRQFRFLHVSTDEVYGSLGQKGSFKETSPLAPNSPYAASKAAADHWVRAAFQTFGLPTLITHCSNNYGPYQFPEKLIPLTILNAVEGKPLPVYGDGLHVRDWIYVQDHCEGLWRVLQRGKPGETYNMGGQRAGEKKGKTTNIRMVRHICRILAELLPPAINPSLRRRGLGRYQDLIRFVSDRPGHDRRYAIDNTKIREELGWRPGHTLESGLSKTVEWYLSHLDWCRAVQEKNYGRERLGLKV